MPRFLRPALVAALLPLTASALAAQAAPAGAPRLAWINSQVIMQNTPGRAEAESTFAREMTGYRAEVQRLQQSLDSAVAEFNRSSVVLTPAARQQREEQLRQLEQRTRARAQELEQQAARREQELTAPLMQRINAVIEGIRAEFNYAFIFDVAQGGTVVTADRSLDITALVIQRLQSGGPPAQPADSTRPAAPAIRPATTPPTPAPAGPRRPNP